MKDFLTFTHISIDIDLYETICGYKTGKKYGRKLKKKKVHVLSNLFFFFLCHIMTWLYWAYAPLHFMLEGEQMELNTAWHAAQGQPWNSTF